MMSLLCGLPKVCSNFLTCSWTTQPTDASIATRPCVTCKRAERILSMRAAWTLLYPWAYLFAEGTFTAAQLRKHWLLTSASRKRFASATVKVLRSTGDASTVSSRRRGLQRPGQGYRTRLQESHHQLWARTATW